MIQNHNDTRIESDPPRINQVLYGHAWVNMANVTVQVNGSFHKTCSPARGYSFAAGTTDGPGQFDFKQGDNSTGTPFWNFIRQFIHKPSKEVTFILKLVNQLSLSKTYFIGYWWSKVPLSMGTKCCRYTIICNSST